MSSPICCYKIKNYIACNNNNHYNYIIIDEVVTYGIVDVGEYAGTWNRAELVKQSLPVHPLTHVQVLGAEHSMLVPHEELQIAKL